jgi:excisionase family DNA binding protein
MHNLLTVKETAKYLRIPLPTVYYLVQRGQLPRSRSEAGGGSKRIPRQRFLKEDRSGQPTVLVVDDDRQSPEPFQGVSSRRSVQPGRGRHSERAIARWKSSTSICSFST